MKTNSDLLSTGCGFINKQLSSLARYLERAKTAEDTEDIHQARVLCRRLRAGFSFLGDYFNEENLRSPLKQLKRLMKFLGRARDLDVQIEFLERVVAELGAEQKKIRPGVQRMTLRWKQRRQSAQAQVVKAIEKTQHKHVLTGIHVEIERALFDIRENPAGTAIGGALNERVDQRLEMRVQEVLGQRSCLEQADDHAAHHALRISAKRLRYEMEIGDLVLGGRLKSCIKKVKTVQTLLGDLHDCVVWESDICAFIEEERQRTLEYYGNDRPLRRILPGLEFLRQERRRHHEALFVEVCDYLGQLEQDNFWQALLESLRTREVIHTEPSEADIEEETDTTHRHHRRSV